MDQEQTRHLAGYSKPYSVFYCVVVKKYVFYQFCILVMIVRTYLEQGLPGMHPPDHCRVIRTGRAQDGKPHPGDRDLPDAVLVARVPPDWCAVQGRTLQVGHDPVGLGPQFVRVTPEFVGVERFAGGDLVQVGVVGGR